MDEPRSGVGVSATGPSQRGSGGHFVLDDVSWKREVYRYTEYRQVDATGNRYPIFLVLSPDRVELYASGVEGATTSAATMWVGEGFWRLELDVAGPSRQQEAALRAAMLDRWPRPKPSAREFVVNQAYGYAALDCWPCPPCPPAAPGAQVVVARILLDLLFDLEHGEVFRQHPKRNAITASLTRCPLVHAIMRKSEYYWSRSRVLDSGWNPEDPGCAQDPSRLHGARVALSQLRDAEQAWLAVCAADTERNAVSRPDLWFDSVDQEVRSVVFWDGRTRGPGCSASWFATASACRSRRQCEADGARRSSGASSAGDAPQNTGELLDEFIATWFLRRYDLDAAILTLLRAHPWPRCVALLGQGKRLALLCLIGVLVMGIAPAAFSALRQGSLRASGPMLYHMLMYLAPVGVVLGLHRIRTRLLRLDRRGSLRTSPPRGSVVSWPESPPVVPKAVPRASAAGSAQSLSAPSSAESVASDSEASARGDPGPSSPRERVLPLQPVQAVVFFGCAFLWLVYWLTDTGFLQGAPTALAVGVIAGPTVGVGAFVIALAWRAAGSVLMWMRLLLPRMLIAICASWFVLCTAEESVVSGLMVDWQSILWVAGSLIAVTWVFSAVEVNNKIHSPLVACERATSIVGIGLLLSVVIGVLVMVVVMKSTIVRNGLLESTDVVVRTQRFTVSGEPVPSVTGDASIWSCRDGLWYVPDDRVNRLDEIPRRLRLEKLEAMSAPGDGPYWSGSEIVLGQIGQLSWGVSGAPLGDEGRRAEAGIPVACSLRGAGVTWDLFPGTLLYFAGISLFFGLFLQLIFDERAITEPL